MAVVLRAVAVMLHAAERTAAMCIFRDGDMVTACQAEAMPTPRFLCKLWVQERAGKMV